MLAPPVPAIVQARMRSRRLPGKMLRRVANRPVLEYVLDRLEHCVTVGPIVIATSDDPSDDPIADFCRNRAVQCTRGPLDDVAARFSQTLQACGFDRFFRLCGDRPLLDTALLDQAAALMTPGVDLVTNAHPRTFPSGQTVELVHGRSFIDACNRICDPADREHVTRYFYEHAGDYRIVNFTSTIQLQHKHLALDCEQDLHRFEGAIERMTRPHWSYGLSEVLELYEAMA